MAGGNGDRLDGEDWQGEDALTPTEQLPLDDDGDRLPWLESADDDADDDGYYASDSSRLLMFALAGLLALVAIVGGIWWLNRGDDAQLADGSVIRAPAEPYKEAPENPGGKTFDGTGDSSFAVSEGQTRPGKLDSGDAVPASPVATAASTASPSATASVTPAPSQASGIGVQVGAFSSQASAEAGWTRLVAAHGSLLSGVSHRVIAGKADIGTVYRLQAVAGDAATANGLCGKLKSAGVPCQVK